MKADDQYVCGSPILERTLDICKISRGVVTGLMINVFLEPVIKAMNFELKCPFKPGYYSIKNARFELPLNLGEMFKGYYCLKIITKAKTPSSRKLIVSVSVGSRFSIF